MAGSLIKSILRHTFELGQHFGLNILPRHFYSPVPDMRVLKQTAGWRKPMDMVGVAGSDAMTQVSFLHDICPVAMAKDWPALGVHARASDANGQGGGYGIIEAEVLYGFILRHKPKRIIQVGCGVSTSVILRAAEVAGYVPDITCVEPYPSAYLLSMGKEGRIKLMGVPAQDVDQLVYAALQSGDMLFVDSTHTVKPGSEVNRIILDVLPRLGRGVFVHFHDIYFPYDYQRSVLTDELFFNTESSLLHAYLADNARIRILLSLSMLHHRAPNAIKAVLPHYVPQDNLDGLRGAGGTHFPSATYLQFV
jgi:Methyltransferase domain